MRPASVLVGQKIRLPPAVETFPDTFSNFWRDTYFYRGASFTSIYNESNPAGAAVAGIGIDDSAVPWSLLSVRQYSTC